MKIRNYVLMSAIVLLALSCKSTKVSTDVKAQTTTLENTKWRLVEVLGKPIAEYGELMKTPEFVFDSKEGRISGNAGCNQIFGSYKLLGGNRIEFGALASTMMACQNMNLEKIFNKSIPIIDTYAIYDNNELVLTKAKMSPVFRFVKVQE
ncbi:MAG: META domain-containing protein [Chitinophagales bacterium]|nr:META domain-containing protein [Chitinophagales bacterium]